VLIVSSTAQGSAEARFASAAADKLAGLAHVVLLETWLARDALNARYPKTVPLRGARLFWPPAAAAERHPWWTGAQLRNASAVSRQLFTMLSRLSVVANSRNYLAETVRQAERDVMRVELKRRVDDAVAAGDLANAVRALTAQVESEQQQVIQALEMNEQLEQENRLLRSYKENFGASSPIRRTRPTLSPRPKSSKSHRTFGNSGRHLRLRPMERSSSPSTRRRHGSTLATRSLIGCATRLRGSPRLLCRGAGWAAGSARA